MNRKEIWEAAEAYVHAEVAENDGSYWGWNTDDMALGKDSFIRGALWMQEQMKPRKIDPDDESTWPPPLETVMLFDGKHWWFGYKAGAWMYFYGDVELWNKNFTHWFQLPTIEDEK